MKVVSSEISKNENQGLYLNKCSFYLNNSQVFENGEEGIDLHVGMKSTIKNTSIFSNKEGGIETELGSMKLSIENCQIKNNGASGVNIQSFEGNSSVSIKNTAISENTDFGLRCAIHAPFASPYFSKMIAVAKDNKISANGKENIDPNCKR